MLVGAVPGDRYEFEFPGRDQKTVDRAGSGDCGTPLLVSQPASLHCTEALHPTQIQAWPVQPLPVPLMHIYLPSSFSGTLLA